jgi:hypothetical protein
MSIFCPVSQCVNCMTHGDNSDRDIITGPNILGASMGLKLSREALLVYQPRMHIPVCGIIPWPA